MRTTRKAIAAILAAAGFATVSAMAYAVPPGAGPGGGPCAYGAGPAAGYGMMGGWGGGGRGPMAGGGGPGARGGYGPGAGPAASADARLAFLKTELKITPDQEAAWEAYAAQAKQQAGTMIALHTQATAPAADAPTRFTQRTEFAKQRAAAMESMSGAVKDLYAALTPEQKAVADQHFGGGRMAQHAGRGGYGQRGHGPWR